MDFVRRHGKRDGRNWMSLEDFLFGRPGQTPAGSQSSQKWWAVYPPNYPLKPLISLDILLRQNRGDRHGGPLQQSPVMPALCG
jgi:hypothetical protein